ncbi:MAG: PepSY-associated TM helix domain-containing protein [Saprospiraceae bacterium]
MKISYKLIKKIHLYACLSTVAVLLMFIITSYLMIHHRWFDHETIKETQTYALAEAPSSAAAWQNWVAEHDVFGRLYKSEQNAAGDLVREYGHAGGFFRVTFLSGQGQVEVMRSTKSTADAIIGIHRHRGYGGGLRYNLYALILDLLGVSLIVFTITGIIMWMRLLKNDKWAWGLFMGGFLYFAITLMYLTYG